MKEKEKYNKMIEEEQRKKEEEENKKREEELKKEQERKIEYENARLRIIENKRRQRQEELIKREEEARKKQENEERLQKIEQDRYNKEINKDGSFICGREKGFENKEFILPEDYECDGCTIFNFIISLKWFIVFFSFCFLCKIFLFIIIKVVIRIIYIHSRRN